MGKDDKLIKPDQLDLSRREYLGIASVLAAPALSGCIGGEDDDDREVPSEPQPGGTLVSSINEPVDTFDPGFIGGMPTHMVAFNMMEQLFRINMDYELEGLLAEDVAIDGDTWDITLRDAEFHPPYDRQLTAEDVISSFNYYTDPDVGSPHGPFIEAAFDEWEAVDDSTVRLILSEPGYDGRGWLGWFGTYIVPSDAIDDHDLDTEPVGTGPFVFQEWEPRDHITMSKFDNYWQDDLPYVDEVVLRPFDEDAVKITELEQGNIDIIETPPTTEIETLQNQNGISVEGGMTGGFANLLINSGSQPTDGRADGLPTTNRNVRQAIAEAVDRNAIAQIAYDGFGEATQTFFPPDHPHHLDYDEYSLDANPDRARELLDEAGFNQPVEINIVSNNARQVSREGGEILRQNLEEAGFDPNLEQLETLDWNDRMFDHEYDIIVKNEPFNPSIDVFIRFYFYPEFATLEPYPEGEENHHEEVYDIWDNATSSGDQEEIAEASEEVQRLLLDDCTNVPIAFETRHHAHRDSVIGVEAHPFKAEYQIEKMWLHE